MSFQMSSNVSSVRGKLASSFGVISPNSVSIGGGVSSSLVFFGVVRLAMSVCSGEDCATPVGDVAGGALFGGESGLIAACALRCSAALCVVGGATAGCSALIATGGCNEPDESSTPLTPSSRKYETCSPASLISTASLSFTLKSCF